MVSGKIRCFIAIEIPTDIKCQLASIQKKNQRNELSWVQSENIHLTVKFVGYVSQSDQPKIEKQLIEISNQQSPFILRVGDLGAFPNFFRPRVIWASIKNGKKVSDLSLRINKALEVIGYLPEKRQFVPHITLARVHTPVNLQKFADYQLPKDLSIAVNHISLMQSQLLSSGAVYDRLSLFSFASA